MEKLTDRKSIGDSIKAVFFDIDGTLVSFETHAVPESARRAIERLRERGIKHLRVVYSPELPAKPEALEAPPPGRRSVPASLVWVPGCAGLMMAGEVILTLAGYEKEKSES